MIPGPGRVHTAAVIARRTRRRFAALAASLVIAAAQSWSAAYACTRGAPSPQLASVAAAPCADMDGMDGDGSSAGGGGNLCEVQCQATPVPSAGMLALAPPADATLAIAARFAIVHGVPADAPEAKGAPPPPRERYCRLQL